MGTFDTVHYKCPHCGKTHEGQTKNVPVPSFEDYQAEGSHNNIPDALMTQLAEEQVEDPLTCDHCGKRFRLRLVSRPTAFVEKVMGAGQDGSGLVDVMMSGMAEEIAEIELADEHGYVPVKRLSVEGVMQSGEWHMSLRYSSGRNDVVNLYLSPKRCGDMLDGKTFDLHSPRGSMTYGSRSGELVLRDFKLRLTGEIQERFNRRLAEQAGRSSG